MDDFFKRLKELDEKVTQASVLRDVTSHIDKPRAFEARTDELKALIREQLKVLEQKHEELSNWIESIKKETQRLIG